MTSKPPTVPGVPVGTLVRYWPGARNGPGRVSHTRTPAWLIGGTPCVSVDGYAGAIALNHVEIFPPNERRDALARAIFVADNAAAKDPEQEWDDAPADAREYAYIIALALLPTIAAAWEDGMDSGFNHTVNAAGMKRNPWK